MTFLSRFRELSLQQKTRPLQRWICISKQIRLEQFRKKFWQKFCALKQVWYNVGHLSLGIGDVNLAYQVCFGLYKVSEMFFFSFHFLQCFRLALTANNDHAESYNNIGELYLGRSIKARQNITLTGVLEIYNI